MCATKTRDAAATAKMATKLQEAGAKIIRVAVDHARDAEALRSIRESTDANLSVDLQENYRLAEQVAPFVDKIRYNPGHLHHAQAEISWQEKVAWIAEIADRHDCALRIGVNAGSLPPDLGERENHMRSSRESDSDDPAMEQTITPMLQIAMAHSDFLERIGFLRFCVSLKDSNPLYVYEVNRRFAQARPAVPLHLGVTEAGMPPEGVEKTRAALEPLLAQGIGDTLRVSLTVPNDRKHEEIEAGESMLKNVAEGKVASPNDWQSTGLNIVSCPSCSRVQNESFVELAEAVRRATRHAEKIPLTIAVMGCRVNGPGETDDADLGLWCGPRKVNLKRGTELLGAYSYEEVIQRLVEELDRLVAIRKSGSEK